MKYYNTWCNICQFYYYYFLQKVNKVLKAKEHVQQKLKEVNKPEKYRNRINLVSKTTEIDYTTGHGHMVVGFTTTYATSAYHL
jgi:hypothetical protein